MDNETLPVQKTEAKDKRDENVTKLAAKTSLPLGLSIVALLLALVACGFFVLALFLWQQQKDEALAGSERVQQQISGVDDNISALQQATSVIKKQQDFQQTHVQEYKQRIEALYSKERYLQEDWVLDETKYLLRLANLNLRWLNDPQAAMTLLAFADDVIAALNNPNLSSLREALAKDSAALKAVPVVDLVGIVSQLNALSEQIPKLPLVTGKTSVQQVTQAQPDEEQETTWHDALADNLQVLKKLIVIRYHEQLIQPLLPPEQRLYLEQNLLLLLQQARWAVLQRQQVIYEDSLAQATDWIKNYFDTESAATKSALDSLNELQKNEIAPELPRLTDPIEQLEALIQQRRVDLSEAFSEDETTATQDADQ